MVVVFQESLLLCRQPSAGRASHGRSKDSDGGDEWAWNLVRLTLQPAAPPHRQGVPGKERGLSRAAL